LAVGAGVLFREIALDLGWLGKKLYEIGAIYLLFMADYTGV
jgi:hypothetical protein